MKKNAVICDTCEITIASAKCDICGKDLCDECSNPENNVIVGSLMKMVTCEGCSEQLDDMMLKRKDLLPEVFGQKEELKKEIVEILKNAMMLHKIEEEKNPTQSVPGIFHPLKKKKAVDEEFIYHLPKRTPRNPINPIYNPYSINYGNSRTKKRT